MECILIKKDYIKKYREIKAINIPAVKGMLQILPGHMDIFLYIDKGNVVLEYYDDQKDNKIIETDNVEAYFSQDVLRIIF